MYNETIQFIEICFASLQNVQNCSFVHRYTPKYCFTGDA